MLGLHPGYADTPMAAGVDLPKADPADVVRVTYDGLAAGEYEVLADSLSEDVKARPAEPLHVMYPQLAGS